MGKPMAWLERVERRSAVAWIWNCEGTASLTIDRDTLERLVDDHCRVDVVYRGDLPVRGSVIREGRKRTIQNFAANSDEKILWWKKPTSTNLDARLENLVPRVQRAKVDGEDVVRVWGTIGGRLGFSIIEAADYDHITALGYRIRPTAGPPQRGFPRVTTVAEGPGATTAQVTLSRIIMGVSETDNENVVVDHIHRHDDSAVPFSDERRANLRLATHGLNIRNQQASKPRYRGVHKQKGRYYAHACPPGGKKRLGGFDSPEAAARAVDNYYRTLSDEVSEFTRYNFPREGELPFLPSHIAEQLENTSDER